MVGRAKGSCLSVAGGGNMSYLAGLACGTFSRHVPSPLPRRQRRHLRPVQQERRRPGTLRPVPVPDDQLVHSGVQGGGTVGGDSPPQGTTAWDDGGGWRLLGGDAFKCILASRRLIIFPQCNKTRYITGVKTGTHASFPFQM